MKNVKTKIHMLCILAVTILLGGCATQKYLMINDGSRADGTLTMMYEYGLFEKPIVHWEDAKQKAISKCQSWGYHGAEFFDVGTSQCITADANGNCTYWRVTFKCQCTVK